MIAAARISPLQGLPGSPIGGCELFHNQGEIYRWTGSLSYADTAPMNSVKLDAIIYTPYCRSVDFGRDQILKPFTSGENADLAVF
jgi:hypothetical protein